MIEKFYKLKKIMMNCIYWDIFSILFIFIISTFSLVPGIIFKDIIGIIFGTVVATISLIAIIFLVKDMIKTINDYKKEKLEFIRILDKYLQEK